MFIGHYATAIGISSFAKSKKGGLAFISTSSVLPDVAMLSAQQFGSKMNFHADLGLLICALAIFTHGKVINADKRLFALSFLAILMHILTDIPYMAQDHTNFYHQRSADFIVEAGFLALAAGLYIYRKSMTNFKKFSFLALVVLMFAMQASWNFIFY